MSRIPIVKWPHPVLTRKTELVASVTEELVALTQRMLVTMYNAPGIGLAANQIGESYKLAVIDTRKLLSTPPETVSDLAKLKFDLTKMTEDEKKLPFPLIMFNPVILETGGTTNSEEGCLSVPTYFDEVKRSARVKFRFTDENGEEREYDVDGLTAVCVQHEVDHLEGRLFLDRLTPIRRSMIKNKIKKHGYPDATK